MEREQQRLLERGREELAKEAQELTAAVREGPRRSTSRAGTHATKPQSRPMRSRPLEATINRAAQQVTIGSALHQAPLDGLGFNRRRRLEAGLLRAEDLKPGTKVRLIKLDTLAEVLEKPGKGHVRVQAGVLRLSVPLAEVAIARHAPRKANSPRKARAKAKPVTSALRASETALRTEDNTADLRGVRVEEGLSQLESFLDRLFGRGMGEAFVLHGHGTGAMKTAVRQYLSASPYVAHSRPGKREEGGDAFTLLWLADR